MHDCLFCRIVRKEVSAEILYEDDQCLVFKDIRPRAPFHCLIIPKKHIKNLFDVKETEDKNLLGHLMCQLPKVAVEHQMHNGFKLKVHTGIAGGQEVDHLHIHLLGTPE